MTSRRSGRPPERAGGDALAALRLVTAALADRKALDPMVLDLRGLTAAADYFVIVSGTSRSEEHTSELQSQSNLVCRLLLEKKKPNARQPADPPRRHSCTV